MTARDKAERAMVAVLEDVNAVLDDGMAWHDDGTFVLTGTEAKGLRDDVQAALALFMES